MKNFYRLIQGNCLDVMKTITSESVDLIFTSLPYEQKREGYRSSDCYGLGLSKGKPYVIRLVPILRELKRILKREGNFFLNFQGQIHNGFYSLTEQMIPIESVKLGWKYVQPHYWVKTNANPDNFDGRLKNAVELVWHFVKSESYCVYKDSVRVPSIWANKDSRAWKYNPKGADPSNVFVSKKSQNQSTIHPALMPLELAERYVKYGSKEGDVVLDPFFGSGTTMRVCQELKRSCIGIEINPKYCKVGKKCCFGRQFLDREVEYKFEVFE